MYKTNPNQLSFEDFKVPFKGQLDSSNRWVKLSQLIPWEEIELSYSKQFSKKMGAKSKSARLAFGALIIKEKLGLTDEETAEQVSENPYLQYFLGLSEFTTEQVFEASMMVHFRKRFDGDFVCKVNEQVVKSQAKDHNDENDDDDKRSGKLLLDATCAPADVTYPTDLKLLNKARELTEQMIDILHEPLDIKKPRTYRKVARKHYLNLAKQKRPRKNARRKGIRKQLGYVSRNLSSIDALIDSGSGLDLLPSVLYHKLLVITEVYRQQQQMYDTKTNRIDGRIVSISQPWVRPIKRGKLSGNTEFGAKLSASKNEDYVFLDKISWDNYNESSDLPEQAELYKQRFGCYPESIHADQIYRTRANRKWCKDNNIRLSGPPLGRKSKDKKSSKQARLDENIRSAIEGKFGQAKRRFSLGRVMAKLKNTSYSSIAMTFLVINLEKVFYYLLFLLAFCSRRLNISFQNKELLHSS